MAEKKKSGYHPGGGVRAKIGRSRNRVRRTPIQPAPDPRGLRKRPARSTGRRVAAPKQRRVASQPALDLSTPRGLRRLASAAKKARVASPTRSN